MHHATVASLRSQLIALAAVLGARARSPAPASSSPGAGARCASCPSCAGVWSVACCSRALSSVPRGARTGELASTAVQGVDALEAYFAGYLPQLVLATVVPVAVIGWVISARPDHCRDPRVHGAAARRSSWCSSARARGAGRGTLARARAARRALPRRRARPPNAARIRPRARPRADRSPMSASATAPRPWARCARRSCPRSC